jgi:hypothetical protein
LDAQPDPATVWVRRIFLVSPMFFLYIWSKVQVGGFGPVGLPLARWFVSPFASWSVDLLASFGKRAHRLTGRRASRRSKRTDQFTGLVHMLLAATRAALVECHLRIQRFVAGIIGLDPPIFQDTEIRTLEHLILIWTNKNKFHIIAQPYFDRPDAAVVWFFPFRNWLSPGEFGWTDTANKGNDFSNDDWVL